MSAIIAKFSLAYRSPWSVALDLMIIIVGAAAATAFLSLFYMIGTTLLCLINIKAGAISSFIDPWVRSWIHTLMFFLSLGVVPAVTVAAIRYAVQFRKALKHAHGY